MKNRIDFVGCLLALKWASIMLLNLTNSLKILPLIFLSFITIFEFYIFRIDIKGLLISIFLIILIALKLIFTDFDINFSSPSGFEGLSFIYLLCITPFFKSENLYNIKVNYLRHSINIILFFLCLDLILRLMLYGLDFFSPAYYTESKYGGLFTVANVAGGLSFFVLVFTRYEKNKLRFILGLITLFGSLSRVSILAYLLYISGRKILEAKNKFFLIFIFILFFFLGVFFYIIKDGSFISKFLILKNILDQIGDINIINILFGHSLNFDKSVEFLGYENLGLHLSFLKAMYYYGLLGFICFLAINLYMIFYCRDKLLAFAFVMIGFSGAPIVSPLQIVMLFSAFNSNRFVSSIYNKIR